MNENCQAAVALSKENSFCNTSEHISLRWSCVVERQSAAIGDIAVVGIICAGMPADIFCSPRPASNLYHFTTQYRDTHRCPLHCYQLRRGTPLDRSWFMPDLNTWRFATVLTHPSTWFLIQNTTIVWLSIDLMCNRSSKVFARKIWYLLVLLFSRLSHIHRHFVFFPEKNDIIQLTYKNVINQFAIVS